MPCPTDENENLFMTRIELHKSFEAIWYQAEVLHKRELDHLEKLQENITKQIEEVETSIKAGIQKYARDVIEGIAASENTTTQFLKFFFGPAIEQENSDRQVTQESTPTLHPELDPEFVCCTEKAVEQLLHEDTEQTEVSPTQPA